MNLEFKLVKLRTKNNGCVRYFQIIIRERCSLTSAMVVRDYKEQTVVQDFNNYLKTKLGKIKKNFILYIVFEARKKVLNKIL